MKDLQHTNLELRLVKEPKDTYIFDEMSEMSESKFFNRQKAGL